jgi:hypothetical protein
MTSVFAVDYTSPETKTPSARLEQQRRSRFQKRTPLAAVRGMTMDETPACESCHWWRREVNPREYDWGYCMLANYREGDFRVLIILDGGEWPEGSPALRTRNRFYCAKFQRRVG